MGSLSENVRIVDAMDQAEEDVPCQMAKQSVMAGLKCPPLTGAQVYRGNHVSTVFGCSWE